MSRTVILLAALGVMLVLAVVGSATYWAQLEDVEMGTDGILAMALGIVLSLALGVGLMWLVFKSSRSGHDDQVVRYDLPGSAELASGEVDGAAGDHDRRMP